MKYKKFNTEYNRLKLLSLFSLSKKQSTGNVRQYSSAVGYSTELLPCMDIFSRTLHSEEYGLSELLISEVMHAKPNNNGLIIFPITNNILIEFNDGGETFLIDTPIATNGKELSKLSPSSTTPSIFFAIKIPSDISFEDAINLLP